MAKPPPVKKVSGSARPPSKKKVGVKSRPRTTKKAATARKKPDLTSAQSTKATPIQSRVSPPFEDGELKKLASEARRYAEYRPFFSPASTDIPEQFLPDISHLTVLDQGSEGASVGFALAGLINLLRSERGERDLVSPRMLQEMSRRYSGLPQNVEGSFIWSGLYGWQRHGVCPESLWPYRPGEPGVISDAAIKAAEANKPKRIEKVDLARDNVRAAVHERHAVIISVKMHDGWMSVTGPEGHIKPYSQSNYFGLHLVVAVGFTPDGFLVQNSWGTGWGGPEIDGVDYPGCAVWPYNDFESNATDAWTAEVEGEVLTERFRNRRGARAGYLPDTVEGQDRLNIGIEVESLAMVIASREVQPPLAIGLFGDWGVGKSFFIKEMQKRLKDLTKEAQRIEDEHESQKQQQQKAQANPTRKSGKNTNSDNEALLEPAFWTNIAQIEFNAWHYSDQNLWASIVVRIFDGLAEHLAGVHGHGLVNQEREAILTRIEETNEEIRALTAELTRVDSKVRDTEEKIAGVDQEIVEKRRTLAGMEISKIAIEEWKQTILQNSTFRKTLGDLGVPTAVDNFEELQLALLDTHSEIGAAKARFAALTTEGRPAMRLLLLVVILVAGALIGLAIDHFLDAGFISKASGVIAGAVASIAGVAKTASRLLRGVNARIVETREKMNQIVRKETKKERDARENLQQELDDLTSEQARVEVELATQKDQRKKLDKQLADLRVGRRLFSFIQERANSIEYRDKLGIVAKIREDFETLSKLLSENSAEKRKRWQEESGVTDSETRGALNSEEKEQAQSGSEEDVASINRIVLYIDDLDRCSPDRVVEVLQAVHLLLALELFVVVVAVDSRWLLRSLEDQYPEFLSLDRELLGQKDIVHRASTPQNYLEKIFQIALAIKPMSQAGYIQLVGDLVGSTVSVAETEDQFAGSEGSHDETVIGGVKKPEDLTDTSGELADRKIDPNPPSLEITPYELELMADLYPFLGTPRTVKRFVNTYRLIRASLSAKELYDYETEGSSDPVAVLVLLALMIGTPMEAPWLFEALDEASNQDGWAKFVDSLKPEEQTLNNAAAGSQRYFMNGVCRVIESNSVPRWHRIHDSLGDYNHIEFETLAPLRKWIGRVARCAFYPFSLENARGGEE